MAITSNVTINEGQVIFKRTSGHTHDGLLSSLIDTKKYSMFDFVPAPLSSDPTRVAFQENNQNIFKSFIVSTIEERVLNPKGIRIQANAITANEIATATITANELVRDFIMVNNTMRSNTFNGTVDKNGNITYEGGTGWAISHTGKTVFNDVSIRGTVVSTSGNIGGWTINSNTITAGSTILRSNGYLKIANGEFTGTIYAGGGTIGPLSIGSSDISGTTTQKIVAVYTDKDWGGTSAPTWTKIGVGVQDNETGSEALSLLTPKGVYVFSSNTPPTWPYTVTQLTSGQLNLSGNSGITIDSTSSTPSIRLASGVSGVITSYANITATSTVVQLTNKALFSVKSGKTSSNTDVIFESLNDGDDKIISTRANGYVSAAYFPGAATGGAAVYRDGGFLYYRTSTIAVKENIEYIQESVIDLINKLKPVKFTIKKDQNDNDFTYELKQLNKEFGFIVEDIQEVEHFFGGSLLSYDSSTPGKFDNINRKPFSDPIDFDDVKPIMYKEQALISLSIKAIQELADKIDNLESRLQALEGV